MEIRIFSGMGNSMAVGRELERRLAADTSTDLLWVFPVYAWGVPPVVVRHLCSQNLAGRRCHMVCTFGDEAGCIDEQWRKLVTSRGGTVGGIFGVQMPNTYVCLPFFDIDGRALQARKLAAATKRVGIISSALLSGNFAPDLHRGPLPRFKSRVIYPWFFRRLMKTGKFHHTVACTGCGTCIRNCPQCNITASSDGTPQWGPDCAFCLRCYHICPHHAVAYGRATARKGQYLHPDFH